MTTSRSALALVLVLAAHAVPALATTYQVGPGRALTQISQVANMLNPGDVVEVDGNATYNTVLLTRSGTLAQPITIRGMATGAQRPVINSNLGHDDALRMDVDNYIVEDMVVAGARVRCVYLHGNNLTLHRVQVHTCTKHGILGADNDSGNMTLTEVEVFNQGNSAAPSAFDHPIYIATDHDLYPTAVLRIERSWVHDNYSGNAIKSRARNAKFFYNWLETTNAQNHTIEAIGPDGQSCPVPNGSNAAILCNAEIVGNVLIARGNNANMMRLGGDGTGQSFGRYHIVNNTFIANGTFNSNSSAMIRAFDGIDSIELHNNIFWVQFDGIRIVRDVEADWVSGRRVTGSNNIVTGNAATYASGIPAQQIQGLTNTIFTNTGAVFVNVSTAALATPGPLDVRLSASSPARLSGNAGNTSSAGFEVPNPTNLPAMQPPQMRPDPGRFSATPRPAATDDFGHIVPNAISLGAYEFTAMPTDFSAEGRSDLLLQHTDGRVAIWLMNGVNSTSQQQILGAASGFSVKRVADMNGDGNADLVWQHTDGRAVIWLMNGATLTSGATILGPGTGWNVALTADFNGDGRNDILWRNNNGAYAVWLMNGTVTTGGGTILAPGSGWTATKAADFNADGRDDILWTHTDGRVSIWLMNGTAVIGGGGILGAATGWTALHAPDLDGDGKADLVWQHADGRIAVWLMDGAVVTGGGGIFGAGTTWTIARVADFNGDGKVDLLWQHPDGRATLWLMNGGAATAQLQVLGAGGGWSAARTGDFNGDGKADIVWQNTDGRVAVWLMNGTTAIGNATILPPGNAFGVFPLESVMLRRNAVRAFVLLAAGVAAALTAHAQNPLASITVDAAANRKAINPQVYGIAHASGAVLSELNVPINRHGGNSTTRYNWQVNADNRGFDWYFQSLAYGSSAAGEGWDSFVQMSRDGGAQPMLTVPIIGWVAKLGPNRGRLASFSIAKYGAQQGNDWQWFPDAGNGVRTNGQPVTGNDPNDASVLVDATFQQQGVQHVVNRWGAAAQGGVRYYILDNEHSIWHSTHRDVRPTGATMDEIRQKMIDHATKIKAVDPNALVVGPEEWGWSGYLFSGYDQQWGSQNGWSNLPDRAAHGGSDYLPWLLRQFRDQHTATGQRLLDVFTVHYYPQGGEFGNDTSTAMQLRRNRSTRSLWDPAYTDETWINDKVRLIPRLKEWVAANYPGTLVGITEYNWGAEGHINGATALADVLGIFGRESLDIAAYWTHPSQNTPAYNAIRMYRNYDGNRSTFGETSVAASGPNPDNVAVFAAQRASDRALTVMVINKYLTGNTPAHIELPGFPSRGPVQVWRLSSSNAITRQADEAMAGGALNVVLPPQSISLFVIPAVTGLPSADFDGTGASDLVWAHPDGRAIVSLMNGSTAASSAQVLGAGSGFTAQQLADMNGDGRADIVWQHTDGRVVVWLMNGTAVAGGGGILGAGTGWTPAFTGDFNADGRADLLWRHANGSYAIWLMNGATTLSGGTILNTGTGWTATRVADFNGDGRADILWTHTDGRAAIWLMNGTAMTGGGSIIGPASGWHVVQAGDFDGDGKADLVWQHTDGRMALWLMNGASMNGGAGILAAGTGWTAARAADFNGDGRTDLLLQHPDGRAAIWLMVGAAIVSQAQVLNAGSGWAAKRTGDFNGDGKADIVWQHADGRTALWLMNGTAVAGGGQVTQGTGFSVSGASP